jgi:hypothetical protein
VIGDLAAHAIDLAHVLAGPLLAVTAAVRTFVAERPAAGGARP